MYIEKQCPDVVNKQEQFSVTNVLDHQDWCMLVKFYFRQNERRSVPIQCYGETILFAYLLFFLHCFEQMKLSLGYQVNVLKLA